MWLYGYIGMISPHHGMEPWQEQHPKACLQLSSCYDHRCFRVCTYVCRKAYELYFLYRNLISVFKMPKKMNLKEYIFICLSASWESVCWKRERSERHISTVLKQSVECWRACVKMWNVEETCSLHPTCPLLFAKVVFQSFIRSTETPEWYDSLTLSQCQKNGNYALMYFNLACENSLVPCSCAI